MCNHACSVFKEAWDRVNGVKKPLWSGIGLLSVFTIVGSALIWMILIIAQMRYFPHLITAMHQDPWYVLENAYTLPVGLLISVLLYYLARALLEMFVFIPMRMGLLLITLNHIDQQPTSGQLIFQFLKWKYIWRFSILIALLSVVIGIPVTVAHAFIWAVHSELLAGTGSIVSAYIIAAALYALALYLSVSYVFCALLVIDRDMTPWRAMEASRKAVAKNWFCVFGALLWCLLSLVIGVALLLVGLIWAIPYVQNVIVILYRKLMN